MSDLEMDLSGLGLRFEELPPSFEPIFPDGWHPFLSRNPSPTTLLRLRVRHRETEHALFEPKALSIRAEGDGAVLALPGGEATLDDRGRLEVALEGRRGESFYNLVNLTLAAMAIRAPLVGGALVHAAAAVVEGRAFLLAGPEGAGKSTWARIAGENGGVAVGEDLILIHDGDLVGTPFRSRELPTGARPGRWPISALLLPQHGTPTRLESARSIEARATLIANLPYVVDLEDHAAVDRVVDRLLREVAILRLTFDRSADFLPLLAARARSDGGASP